MQAPGVYRRTTEGRLIVGEMDGRITARIRDLAATLAHVVETEISDNIIGVLWGKLIWNGAVSGLCAISGKRLGALFDCDVGRELFLRAFHESVATARSDRVRIEPVIVRAGRLLLGAGDPPEKRRAISSARTASLRSTRT